MQLQWPLREGVERGMELEAVPEEVDPGKDVEAEARAGHGHDQTSDISQVTHVVSADKREEDVVVLLTLELVHCRDLVRHTDHLIVSTSGN